MSECGICMEQIKSKDIFKTNCGHTFHNSCITQWLLPKSSCPICRNNLTKDIGQNSDTGSEISDEDEDEDDDGVFLMYVWEKDCKPENEEYVMSQIEAQIQEYEEENSHTTDYTLESNIRIKEKRTCKIIYYNITKIRSNGFVIDVYDHEIKLDYKEKFYRSKSKYKFKKNNSYLKRSTKCKVLSF